MIRNDSVIVNGIVCYMIKLFLPLIYRSIDGNYTFKSILRNLTPDSNCASSRNLQELYQDWNLKINVVSRKDIDELYLASRFAFLSNR